MPLCKNSPQRTCLLVQRTAGSTQPPRLIRDRSQNHTSRMATIARIPTVEPVCGTRRPEPTYPFPMPAEPATITAPPPQDMRRAALQLALTFAFIKFAIHLVTNLLQPHLGWGYFRDELYYIACGHHLGFGYVDHGPIIALQARLAQILFGNSLAGIRMLSAVAGAGKVFLTGLLCWRLGGNRWAQSLAMLAVLLAPQYLGTDGYLSMNSFEGVFWMTCVYALIALVQGGNPRWWLIFGLSAGIGLENKPSMTFFLLTLLLALIVTRQRRLLFAREYVGSAALGVTLLIALAAPNIIWQIHNHWPTLEFLHNGVVQHKNIALPLPQFISQQILQFNPIGSILWITGVLWLLIARAAKPWRWIGLTYLFFFVLMFILHAKDYYLAPIYPVLCAAGAVAFFAPRLARPWWQSAYALVLVITGLLLLPAAIPVMRPEIQLAYLLRMHLQGRPLEKWKQGPFPQFFTDRFGWQEMADQTTAAYNSLSPADRARAGIFAGNYGEAGAISLLAPRPADGSKLPTVVSGQNSYFLWGPNNYSGDVMIVVVSAPIDDIQQYYGDVKLFAHVGNPWSMPFEHVNVYIVRHRKFNFAQAWPEMKDYI